MLTVYNLDLSYDNSEFRLIAANAFCYDTSAIVRLNVSNANVAVNNVESELFEVYPNPFTEVLYITNHHYLKNESYSIEFYNASGQVVLSTTLRNSQDYIIFDKGLESGFYFLIIRDRDKKEVNYKKLIKS
jgi:hypothetical protein